MVLPLFCPMKIVDKHMYWYNCLYHVLLVVQTSSLQNVLDTMQIVVPAKFPYNVYLSNILLYMIRVSLKHYLL